MWAKSEFLANMSHEIRHTNEWRDRNDGLFVGHRPEPGSAALYRAGTLQRETLLSLINDILDFSKWTPENWNWRL